MHISMKIVFYYALSTGIIFKKIELGLQAHFYLASPFISWFLIETPQETKRANI